MIDERLTNLPGRVAVEATTRVAAARPPSTWLGHTAGIAERLRLDMDTVTGHLRTAVTDWNRDPAHTTTGQLGHIGAARTRLEAQHGDPTRRWATLADQIDPRLTTQSDWPALADMLQTANDAGHDVPTLTRRLVTHAPLGQVPAQELRYRLVATLPETAQPPSLVEENVALVAPRRADRKQPRPAPAHRHAIGR
jgi:hypothetical protein